VINWFQAFAFKCNLYRYDLDKQLKSFLSLLPKDVAAAALAAIKKQAPKAPQATKVGAVQVEFS
jgi:hypothetical protein